MAITPGIVDQISYRVSSSTTSYTTFDGFLVNAPTFDDQTPTLPTGKAIDKRIGYTQGFDFISYEYSKFGALSTLMLAGTAIELRFHFGSTIYAYDPVYFIVSPVFGQLADKAKVWTAAAGSTTTVADPPWTDQGLLRGGSQPTIEAGSTPDGLDRPIFTQFRLNHEFELIDPDVAALQSWESARAAVAIEMPDGDHIIYDNVDLKSIPQPNVGADELVTRLVQCQAADRTLTNIFTTPSTVNDYYFGFRLVGTATGTAESDILTIT